MTGVVAVHVNCASEEEAEAIASAALAHRLAAAANMHGAIDSFFHWEGAVETTEEVPLVLKTRAELFDDLASLIMDLHSYETPAILGFRADYVNADYAKWLREVTRSPE